MKPKFRSLGSKPKNEEKLSKRPLLRELNSSEESLERDGTIDIGDRATAIYGGLPTAAGILPQFPGSTSNKSEASTPEKAASSDRAPHWSGSVQNLLEQPTAAFPRQVMLGGLAFCAVFTTWAWYGEINEVGKARGELVYQGNVHKIHPVEMGKVAYLAVKEGDTVKAGQPIAELDTQLAIAEVERLSQQLSAYEIELMQTQGSIDRLRLEAQTRAAISSANLQAQEASIAQAETNAAITQQTIEGLQTELGAMETQKNRIDPLPVRAGQLREQLQEQVSKNQERLNRLQPLVERGAISRDLLFQAEQDLLNSQNALLRTELNDETVASERVFDIEQNLRDRQSRISENHGRLEQAAAEADRLYAELAQKKAEGERTQLEIQQQVHQLEIQIAGIEAQMAQTSNLLSSAEAKLERRFLYAPVDGVILALHLNHSGEVVQPGQTIAEIAPEEAPLVLSAKLPDREAGFIEVGMPAQIKFDAYPFQEYGLVEGTVASIAPDSESLPEMGEVFEVEIELARNYVTEEGAKINFKSGQTADAEIVIRRRRIVDVLLDPLRQLKEGGVNF
ncbi:HlyD family efflux transporter periplasmic adaptor subunit [Oscillatoriales cyanobacterium LEGE 11467]|uniref:HlyD family efflux transporter periplasmic adaptor subunit n=1 Tax=Zarconia navalis LEGE 11467 TaxID=1828826 RepID=A0A928W1S8_9CYAN|nr:HlyD family efflux transporter periplasmic adaptor subunit [Zarconia navalis]MBE9041670.1 HlyD family efflux transporter periplasmic adaptor subunit [Zarconia navalis LEGE 11467]